MCVSLCVCVCVRHLSALITIKELRQSVSHRWTYRSPTSSRFSLASRHQPCVPYTRPRKHTHTHHNHIRPVFHSGRSICFDRYTESDPRLLQCLLLTNKGVWWLSVEGQPLHLALLPCLSGKSGTTPALPPTLSGQ